MISKAGSGGLLKYQTTISFTVGGIAMALYVFLEVSAHSSSQSIPCALSRCSTTLLTCRRLGARHSSSPSRRSRSSTRFTACRRHENVDQ